MGMPKYPPPRHPCKALPLGNGLLQAGAMDLAIPPLPPSWPFTPRGADREELRMVKTELPGLPGWWTLHTRGELPLEGEAEGLAGAFGRGGVLRLGEVVLRPY